MRGAGEQTSSLFSSVSCEARVPSSHPLRRIRAVVDEALDVLSPDFDGMYAQAGRPSIAPETLLRALLLRSSTQAQQHVTSEPKSGACVLRKSKLLRDQNRATYNFGTPAVLRSPSVAQGWAAAARRKR